MLEQLFYITPVSSLPLICELESDKTRATDALMWLNYGTPTQRAGRKPGKEKTRKDRASRKRQEKKS